MQKSESMLPVVILAVAAFVFNASEFAPIGLLSAIATDLDRTESSVGFIISAYAWVVMLMSLPLMVMCSRIEYRRLMLTVVGLFTVSHAISGFATGYNMLLFSRIGVACSHAIFWSVTTPLAVKVAPRGKGAVAMSMIVVGSSLAQIVGMPLGRVFGLAMGWRWTFLLIGALSAAVLAMLLISFPKVDNDSDFKLRDLPGVFRNRKLILIYATVIAFILGHFTVYSYIEPYLLKEAAFDAATVTFVLMMIGAAGLVASVLFSRLYPTQQRSLMSVASLFLPLMLFVLPFARFSVYNTVLLCIVWGTSQMLINMILQARLMDVEKRATTVAMSLYSGLFNLGIGGGAAIGGYICDTSGIGSICWAGALIALVGTGLALYQYRRV